MLIDVRVISVFVLVLIFILATLEAHHVELVLREAREALDSAVPAQLRHSLHVRRGQQLSGDSASRPRRVVVIRARAADATGNGGLEVDGVLFLSDCNVTVPGRVGIVSRLELRDQRSGSSGDGKKG